MRYSCSQCGGDFTRPPRKGPAPRYCTARCRKAASRARAPRLPVEMTNLPRWTARDGKRPVMVDGQPASSTVADTWTTYEAVKHGPHGIMLGRGIACWDLDHCLEGNIVAGWAQDVIAGIDPSTVIWSERSMSGDGLHIFVRAPEGPGRKNGGIEFYSRARFIAVTGDRFND